MKRRAANGKNHGRTVEDVTQQNVEKILRLEHATKANATVSDRIADAITRFCGSMLFVVLHAIWYGGWVAANLWLPKSYRFDPFPFEFLTLVVSLEAIFLSTFILISQNRQSTLGERRSHLDLQIDMLAEQENTKILDLLEKIAARVGAECNKDEEVNALREALKPEQLVRQIERTIEKTEKAEKQ